jgi:cation transport ATPase
MAQLRVHVHDMDCADEAALVRRALAGTPGVAAIDFDLVHGFADIIFDDHVTSEQTLLHGVRSTGLRAHPVHGEDGQRVVADEHAHHDHQPHSSTVATTVSGALFLAGWVIEGVRAEHWADLFVHRDHAGHDPIAAVAYGAAAFAGLWPMLPRAAASVRHLRLDMHALVCLTVIGAAAIGEWSEGAAVAFLFGLAHRMEAWSIERARREIAALVGRGPALVAQGAQHPPSPTYTIKAVEGWGGSGGDVERAIERFAAIYTPLVALAALIVAVVPPLLDGGWTTWLYRALFFLVLACPCALVISTPVTLIAALTAAARRGILIKGGAVLERAVHARSATRRGLAEAGITIAGAHAYAEAASADVVLADPDERSIVLLVDHARRALRVVRQNITLALLTKIAFLIAAPFGYAPLWLAVLADTGATVLVTLNGLRLLGVRAAGTATRQARPVGSTPQAPEGPGR